MKGLIDQALMLDSITDEVMSALQARDTERFAEALIRFTETKKQIKVALIEQPLVSLPGQEHEQARRTLQRIKLGEPLPLEEALAGSPMKRVLEDELTAEEIDRLGSDMFYDWFSHHEYVEGLYRMGSLIVAVGELPESLSGFVDEMRKCFVFQQYRAVYALCRTALEIAVRDIYIRQGFADPYSEAFEQVERYVEHHYPSLRDRVRKFNPSLFDMMRLLEEMSRFHPLSEAMHNVRIRTNSLIHGNRDVGAHEAETTMRETLRLVHELYEAEA